MPDFNVGDGAINSGPHVCATSVFVPPEPSPSLGIVFEVQFCIVDCWGTVMKKNIQIQGQRNF